MRGKRFQIACCGLCLAVILSCCVGLTGGAASSGSVVADRVDPAPAAGAGHLETIVRAIGPVSREAELRRNIAQATFCLPQNVVGILYYALLKLTGNVVDSEGMNETTIVVTKAPLGVSLGKFIFLNESLLTENTVRHEYGHTLQGYRHGPFYLLLEGATSLVQAAVSLVVPSFGVAYFDRWPENEANVLGGVVQLAVSAAESVSSRR